jgi:hypothetical protein
MQNTPDRDNLQPNIPPQHMTPQHMAHLCKAPTGSPYTDDEWKTLTMTPLQVGKAMIVTSASGPLGTVQEVRALNKTLTEALNQGTSSPLLKEMGQTLKQMVDTSTGGQVQQIKESMIGQRVDPQTARSTALASAQQANTLLKKVSAQDALSYKEMVYQVARKVAEAARTGGFLGIAGGEVISKPEQELLNNLASTLGIQRS